MPLVVIVVFLDIQYHMHILDGILGLPIVKDYFDNRAGGISFDEKILVKYGLKLLFYLTLLIELWKIVRKYVFHKEYSSVHHRLRKYIKFALVWISTSYFFVGICMIIAISPETLGEILSGIFVIFILWAAACIMVITLLGVNFIIRKFTFNRVTKNVEFVDNAELLKKE